MTQNSSGLFKFPTDPEMLKIWMELCGISENRKQARICSDHFLKSDFSTNSRDRNHLLSQSVPSLNLNLTKRKGIGKIRRCVVPNCQTKG